MYPKIRMEVRAPNIGLDSEGSSSEEVTPLAKNNEMEPIPAQNATNFRILEGKPIGTILE